MDWRGFIMEVVTASIITGVFGVIAVLVTNIFVDKRGCDKIDRKIGDISNTTLSGQHKNIEKAIISKTDGVEKSIINKTDTIGKSIIDRTSNIYTKVDKISDLVNKNEGLYQNLNMDQKEVRNNVSSLIYNWEATISENKELKLEIKILKNQINELTKENRQLKSKSQDYPLIDRDDFDLEL